jgi:hypothetical protein
MSLRMGLRKIADEQYVIKIEAQATRDKAAPVLSAIWKANSWESENGISTYMFSFRDPATTLMHRPTTGPGAALESRFPASAEAFIPAIIRMCRRPSCESMEWRVRATIWNLRIQEEFFFFLKEKEKYVTAPPSLGLAIIMYHIWYAFPWVYQTTGKLQWITRHAGPPV